MKLRLLDCTLIGVLAGAASLARAQAERPATIAQASPELWATEDPDPGRPELSITAASVALFDGTRITRPVEFQVRGNYTAFVARYEITLYLASDIDLVAPIATLPVDVAPVASAQWDGTLSSGTLGVGDTLVYVLRAYDKQGRFDETYPRPIQLVRPADADRTAMPPRTALLDDAFAQQGLKRQTIPIRGSRVRIQGRNLPQGASLKINGDAYPIDQERKFVAEYLMPPGRHTFDVATSGGDAKTLTVDVTGRYFFGVGLADVTISQGNVARATHPTDAEDVISDGRLAFYGKAKLRGRYLLTAQADTTERDLEHLFDGFGAAYPYDIFRRLDPDLYYPTYGDDSTTWRDVDTMGHFYLRMDWDRSQVLWGNYATGLTGTDFAQYVRSLYGAALNWQSEATTSSGESKRALRAFGSQAQTAPGHNEFLGTGGSLYYLRNTDILPGSDSVVLEVRDTTTGRVERRVTLQRGADYEIDELQGRILLTRPLSQITRDAMPTLTRDVPQEGFEQHLLVDYEWVPSGFDADEITAGVRGKQWFGDHLGLGLTYVDENHAGQDYTLAAGDVTLQAGRGTWIKAEYAQTESFGAPVFSSDNGGFTFTLADDAPLHREGDARAIEARANLRELGWSDEDWSAGAWWRQASEGYWTSRYASGLPLSEYGMDMVGQVTDAVSVYARYTRMERGTDALVQTQGTVEWRIDDANALSSELRRVDETVEGVRGIGLLGALKYTRRIDTALDVFGQVQYTLDDDDGRYADNNALVVGGQYQFGNQSSLGVDASTGDRGNAATLNADYRVTPEYAVYGGYTYSTDTTEADLAFDPARPDGWTLGQRWRVSRHADLYNESQFLKEPTQSGLAHTFGMDFHPDQGWNMGVALQSGALDGSSGIVDRRAVSVGGGRASPRTDWQSKLEWRRDTGAEQREQWVGSHRFAHKLDRSWRIVARLNHADTDDRLNAAASAQLVEGNVGFAYRPWNHERWGVFGRYTYLYDLATQGQVGGAEVDQKSRILSLEGVYTHDQHWAYAAKLARRNGEVRYERGAGPWFDSGTGFAAAQVRYELRTQWHALVEYRWLHVDHDGGTQRGFLVGLDRDVNAHVRIGAGYNFTDFSDDLTEFDDDHRGWFVNLSGSY